MYRALVPLLVISKVLTLAYVYPNASIFVDFGYDCYFMQSSFKFLREKIIFKGRKHTFADLNYCFCRRKFE